MLKVSALYFITLIVAAATALLDIEGLSAQDIALKSMKIAADLCVYTNHNTCLEVLKTRSGIILPNKDKLL